MIRKSIALLANYQQIIERYIAERPSRKWPKTLKARQARLGKNPLNIPFLPGFPEDFLPLYPDWVCWYGFGIYGIRTNLCMETYQIDWRDPSFSVNRSHTYPSLLEMLNWSIESRAIKPYEVYQKYYLQLRQQYPDLALLFIDPHKIPPKIWHELYDWPNFDQ